MIPFADNPAIDTAPLPFLVALTGVGALVVVYREAILDWCRTTLGGTGGFVGRAFIVIGGYGWLLIGLAGVVFWLADQF